MSLIGVRGKIADVRDDGNVHWKLPDNKLTCTMCVDYYYESPPFHFLSRSWCLRFYPNGDINNEGFYTVYLDFKSSAQSEASLMLNIALKLSSDNVSEIGNRMKTATHTFSDDDRCYVWGNILQSDSVWNNKLNSSALTISCFATKGFIPVVAYPSMCKKTQVSEDLKNLFLEERDTDVTFKVQTGVFKAHKLILQARSKKFNELFQDYVNINCFQIENCEPDAFKMFLQFLYTGTVDDFSIANAISLYTIAVGYSCVDLQRLCTEFMVNRISNETSGGISTLAYEYRDKRLLAACERICLEESNQSNPQSNG